MKVVFSTNFRPKTKKIVRAVFEKNIKVSDFGLIWRLFREYLQIKNFIQKSGSVTFLALYSPNFLQKIRKILRVISEKTALPTNQPNNQPIVTNNTDLIGPRWRRSKKQNSNQNVKVENMLVFDETYDYYHYKFNFDNFLSCPVKL